VFKIRIHNKKWSIFIICLIILNVVLFPIINTADEETSRETIEDKLLSITEEEKEILEFLFIQVQEIEELEREEKSLSEELSIMQFEIENLEDRITSEELSYNSYKDVLKEVLKTYQRMGPGSYIEIILSSNSITDLFNRINTLRDLTKGTGSLLEDLDDSLAKLSLQKENLAEKLSELENKQVELRAAIDKKAQVIKTKEDYLISLADDKDYYLERLTDMNNAMNELKTIIIELSEEFTHLIEGANFSEDAIKLELSISGMKGSIDEDVFNKIISEHPGFPEMKFEFKPGRVELAIPERNVFFAGNFIVIDGKSLEYEITEGRIYDLKLEKSSIEDLFSTGYFILNLEPLIDKNSIKSIESKNGYMELGIGIKLF
jgi:peptidoglycan hydrolase CwlO-like protein